MNTENELNIKRIQSLTDATFAVAMTILILEVKVPPGLSQDVLVNHFKDHTWRSLFIFMIGFVTLGVFWVGSHFHHHHLVRTDRISSWLNLLFLMFICVIPFSIDFLRNYHQQQISIVFYSVNLLIASLINFIMIWYAWKREYVKPYYTIKNYKNARLRVLLPVICYIFIIFISCLNAEVAVLFFLLPILIHLVPEKANACLSQEG
jgi:uncharacterized membrane protein